MKAIIIGGVAAGASAAARLRRLDEHAQIVLLEKGGDISYANCGLPYHVGGVIRDRARLSVMPPAKFASWFRIDVRTRSEAIAIDRARKTVTVRGPDGEYAESYDKLLLATGATPAGQPFTDADHPRVAHLWTLADMDRVVALLPGAKSAVVVGAGFIGLEAAENLRGRGLAVTIVQRGAHVLPTLDPEMAHPLAAELASLGIDVRFGRQVADFEEKPDGLDVALDDGSRLRTDLAIVCTGVRPRSELAAAAGLELGPRGHVVVDDHLRTSDPDIYAAGDVIEVAEPILGGRTAIALAGPANKQGRIAADNIAGGSSVYRGTFGASIVKVGSLAAGGVGLTEARLKALGRPYRKIYAHPSSGAGYYPGAARLDMKLLFGDDGAIYGAQIVGAKGVDKRIDTLAQAMRNGLKAPRLGELELAYAPPFSSAKDPVNFLGFIAENVLTGKTDPVAPDEIPPDALVVDVREPDEHELGGVPGAVNIPLGTLRDRLGELDKARPVVVHCQVGLRGYLAERILKQNGFTAYNLSGGWLTWKAFHPDPVPAARHTPPGGLAATPLPEGGKTGETPPAARSTPPGGLAATPLPEGGKTGETPPSERGDAPQGQGGVLRAAEMPTPSVPLPELDVRSIPCPGPVVKLKAAFKDAAPGTGVRLLADATFEPDLLRWCDANGCVPSGLRKSGAELEADIVKGGGAAAPAAAPASPTQPAKHSVAIVLFSNDLDKALAALILANGLAASGADVGIFFTFWGLSVLRRNPAPSVRKGLVSRMFGWMLPTGAEKLALSKMNMLGLGTAMMKGVMRRQRIMTLPELLASARGAGVKFIACDMAMGVMGITREELVEVDEVAGVAAFAELARRSNNTLFI